METNIGAISIGNMQHIQKHNNSFQRTTISVIFFAKQKKPPLMVAAEAGVLRRPVERLALSPLRSLRTSRSTGRFSLIIRMLSHPLSG